MDKDSNRAIRKNVKTQGIRGLKEKEDYEIVYDVYPILSVVPKSWEASKFIASRDIGGIEGKWCTAYQKNPTYWNDYIDHRGGVLIYTIDFEKSDKVAMYISKSGRTFEFFNANDDEVNKNFFLEFLGITDKEYQEIIKKARNVEIPKKVYKKGDVWNDGTWEEGTWEGGHWRNGTWEGGRWKTGFWGNGVWENGFWEKGTWEDGTWENGFWQDGTWKEGTWEGGTWIKGKIKSIKFKDLILSYKNPEEFYELEREASTKEELINLVGKK